MIDRKAGIKLIKLNIIEHDVEKSQWESICKSGKHTFYTDRNVNS